MKSTPKISAFDARAAIVQCTLIYTYRFWIMQVLIERGARWLTSLHLIFAQHEISWGRVVPACLIWADILTNVSQHLSWTDTAELVQNDACEQPDKPRSLQIPPVRSSCHWISTFSISKSIGMKQEMILPWKSVSFSRLYHACVRSYYNLSYTNLDMQVKIPKQKTFAGSYGHWTA